MATSVLPHGAPTLRYRRVPWSPRAWSQALYLAGGIPAQLVPLPPLVVLERPGGRGPDGRCGRCCCLLVVVFLAVPLLTGIHRHRLRATAGVAIPPQPVIPDRLTRRGIVAAARARATWRQLGYHLLAAPALAAAAIVAVGMWLAGVLYTLVYAYAWTLPAGSLLQRGQSAPLPGHLPPHLLGIPMDVYLTAGRDRAAGRRAVAHRRGRGAGRQGRPGAARPEPRRGAGVPGGTPDPDPGRRGRRRRRRAAPPGAGPARRHPAAAGLARHEPGHGPAPNAQTRRRRTRPSPRPTRRPRPPWPSCAT